MIIIHNSFSSPPLGWTFHRGAYGFFFFFFFKQISPLMKYTSRTLLYKSLVNSLSWKFKLNNTNNVNKKTHIALQVHRLLDLGHDINLLFPILFQVKMPRPGAIIVPVIVWKFALDDIATSSQHSMGCVLDWRGVFLIFSFWSVTSHHDLLFVNCWWTIVLTFINIDYIWVHGALNC